MKSVKIIEPKKRDVTQFVSKLEFDNLAVELSQRVAECISQYKELTDMFNAFFERYNENVRRTNEAIGALCSAANKNGETVH